MNHSNNSLSSPEGVSLKEYINDKFDNLEKTIDERFNSVGQTTNAALAASDKAIAKSDTAMEKRLDSVNEFRATLSDQASKFIIRTEHDLVVSRLEQDIKNLQFARTELMPRMEALGLFKAVDKKFKEILLELNLLREYRSEVSGRGKGLDAGWGYVLGAAGLVGALFGIISFFR